MKVIKFGGSSLANASTIGAAIAITKDRINEGRLVVVVSAMKGVTDSLIQLASGAAERAIDRGNAIEKIASLHIQALAELAPTRGKKDKPVVERLIDELSEISHGVELTRECSMRMLDYITGFGERLSALLITAGLQEQGIPARCVDSREFIITDQYHGRAAVDFDETNMRLVRLPLVEGEPAVLPGFIASTMDGISTTLGRNGSDYTATILGAALDADSVEIWTDVDGVLSADPSVVSDAFVLPHISFRETMELSYFGATVIHPSAMGPVIEKEIPTIIKNTLAPEMPGTIISNRSSGLSVTGIASIKELAMVTIEGIGMVGMKGIAAQVYQAIADADANIVMISQASSEHSICLVCSNGDARRAIPLLKRQFSREIETRRIDIPHINFDIEVIALVGGNMRGMPGIAGKLFGALGDADINILAIAQGSTEMNISLVVKQSEGDEAVRAIHRAFFT